ncbi:MAG: hypothetical protein AAGF28_02670, partial [Pseudomonadota bacterium]
MNRQQTSAPLRRIQTRSVSIQLIGPKVWNEPIPTEFLRRGEGLAIVFFAANLRRSFRAETILRRLFYTRAIRFEE